MRIKKILNNNVITVIGENKKEIVIMGRGIAFSKQCGDIVSEDKIEKKFILKDDNDILLKFEQMISNIPHEHMEVSYEIIEYVKEHIDKDLSDQIYLSLTDHINFAIKRYKNGLEIKNAMLWDMKKFYSKEFKMGMKAVQIIKEKLGIDFSEDEAGFIAFHIINAEFNQSMPELMSVTKLVEDILNIVKYYFKLDFDEECINYYRFVTHLKFFAYRMLKNVCYKDDDDFLYKIIKDKYHKPYLCSCKIKQYLKKAHNYELADEEMIYLTIHIERVVNRN